MKRGVEAALMVSLLEDAYNLWMCEGLSTAAYKGLAEVIMEKADDGDIIYHTINKGE